MRRHPLKRAPGWARCAALGAAALLPILLLFSISRAACPLPVPAGKGAGIDEGFQHQTLSPGGFFELFWNSSGDSALAADSVPFILAALDSAQTFYMGLPGAWPVPLGPRAHYPVIVVRQNQPGATTFPYEDGGVSGLTWIQLDHDFGRWGGNALQLLQVTCAHEFFHALQFARGFDLRDLSFCEAGAVWAEDQVHPGHDDWAARYLPTFLATLSEPLTASDGLRDYGAAALVKFLLVGEGDWGPLRQALLADHDQARSWAVLLANLAAAPQLEMARALAELVGAGAQHDSRPWRVPELADAAPVNRGLYAGLQASVDGVPAGADLIEGLSWQPMPVGGSGRLALSSSSAGLYHLAGASAEPSQLADSARVTLLSGDWLLLVNSGSSEAEGLLQAAWDTPWASSFRVWPNPGDRRRHVEFFSQATPLVICNLLGQRVGVWSPPGPGPGPFVLDLPASAQGTLLLQERGGRGLALTVR